MEAAKGLEVRPNCVSEVSRTWAAGGRVPAEVSGVGGTRHWPRGTAAQRPAGAPRRAYPPTLGARKGHTESCVFKLKHR